MIGEIFGHWTVLRRAATLSHYNARWLCRCECGSEKSVRADKLKAGRTKSCGCTKGGGRNRTHGMSETRSYSIWGCMKKRCFDPKQNGFENYGGRGITVCEGWMEFEQFYADMGDCPEGMTLERKDTEKNYEPGNCRWATWTEQARNRSNNRKIEINGETRVLSEWCETLGANYNTVYGRLARGLTPEKAFGLDRRQSC